MLQTYEILRNKKKVEDIFSPFTPIAVENDFIGRYHELKELLNAIKEKGKHILLYGKRGVGKTSLSNIMISKCQENKKISICRSSAVYAMSFEELWENLLEQVENERLKELISQKKGKKITIRTLTEIFSQAKQPTIFIIDEFDLISKEEKNRNMFASLIKSLSDSCPNITLTLIGIGNQISELIGHHTSLERCLVEFYLPKMGEKEIRDLIEGGARKAGLHFQEEVKKNIVDYSTGYPYFAHLLAKYSCENAIAMHYNCIMIKNFHEGIKLAIENSKTLFQKQIQKAFSTKNPHYAETLMLAAQQQKNEFSDDDLKKIAANPNTKFSFYLLQLTKKNRGEILERKEENKKWKYYFKNYLLRKYLCMQIEQNKPHGPKIHGPTHKISPKINTALSSKSGKNQPF